MKSAAQHKRREQAEKHRAAVASKKKEERMKSAALHKRREQAEKHRAAVASKKIEEKRKSAAVREEQTKQAASQTKAKKFVPAYSATRASSVWGNDRIGKGHGTGNLNSNQGWSAKYNKR